jgi:hypothetical protein
MRRFLACLVFTACSSNNNEPSNMGDDAPPPDAGSGSNTTPVTPKIGGWEYDEVTPVSSTPTARRASRAR